MSVTEAPGIATVPPAAEGQTGHGEQYPQAGELSPPGPATPPTLEQFLAQVESQAMAAAYGALWDRETALDVVQDSMLRLVQYYRERHAGEWPPLFHTILRSRINDVRRRRLLLDGGRKLLSLTGLRAQPDDDHGPGDWEVPATPRDDAISAPEAGLHGEQLKQRIEAALAALPWRQRQVFLLREQQGRPIKETAEILGCSENSIKQHHFRALRTLRQQLAEVWDHE